MAPPKPAGHTLTLTRSSVPIQITPVSQPAVLSWMGEVTIFAQMLTHESVLTGIQEQVRFARARFGRYVLIDFVAVFIGYAVRLCWPFTSGLPRGTCLFMALFG